MRPFILIGLLLAVSVGIAIAAPTTVSRGGTCDTRVDSLQIIPGKSAIVHVSCVNGGSRVVGRKELLIELVAPPPEGDAGARAAHITDERGIFVSNTPAGWITDVNALVSRAESGVASAYAAGRFSY